MTDDDKKTEATTDATEAKAKDAKAEEVKVEAAK